MNRIVVGTDGSAIADRAMDWAHDEAARWGAELCVVHAWSYPYGYGGARVSVEEPPELVRLDAARVLDEACDALLARKGDGVTVHRCLRAGSAARMLVEESTDADLVVVGSRGHGGFRALLLGSTAHQVAQHAACPVVVVRDREATT